MHSKITGGKKPDFQEFLIIPETNSVLQAWHINKDAQINAEIILKNIDKKFNGKRNDENAWISSLSNKEVLDVLKDLKDNICDERRLYLDEGFDAAASSLFKRKKYYY